jgi:hypothetical protein
MRIELWIFFITIGLIYNTYYDGKYSKLLKDNIKYIKIALIGFGGLILYLFLKRHPTESHSLLKHAADIVKYMPIDKNSKDLVTPFLDITSNSNFLQGNAISNLSPTNSNTLPVQTKNYGRSNGYGHNRHKRPMKRSVSETKKKFVASNQNWICNHCKQQLDATYEIDHVIELQYGGTNDVTNLVALCRNCHGKKTMMNRM